jgi:hypothetical protein
MARRPNLIPTQQLNLALPLPVFTQLTAHLYSDLEGRVPHAAYSRFLTDLIRGYFVHKQLDLAPWTSAAPGSFMVEGSPEAISALEVLLQGDPS